MDSFVQFSRRAQVVLAFGWVAWLSATIMPASGQAAPPDFANQIAPILQRNCVACHNTQKAEGKLNLESFASLSKGGESGATIVVGKSAESLLLERVKPDSSDIMPPDGNALGAKRLTAEEIALVAAWIDSGATVGTASSKTMQWRALPETVRPIYALNATPDGQWVSVGRGNQAVVYRWPSFDGPADTAQLIDPAVQTQLKITAPVAHLDLIQSIALSPDGTRIASGGFRDIKIWHRSEAPSESVLSKRLNGSTSAVRSHDNLWIAHSTQPQRIELTHCDTATMKFFIDLPAAISSYTWSLDSKDLIVNTSDGALLIYAIPAVDPNAASAPIAARFTQPLATAFTKLLALETQSFAAITADRKVQIWTWNQPAADQPGTYQKSDKLADQAEITAATVLTKPTQTLVLGISDGNIRFANPVDGAILRNIQHGSPVQRIVATNDSSKLFSLGSDGVIKAWNAADGNLLWENRTDLSQNLAIQLADRKVARQQVKVDRDNAKIPELERAKQAEMDSKEKLQKSRMEAAELVAKKQMELEANDKMVADSETALTAAKLAVEEAMKKVEQSQKDVEAKKAQRLVAEKAKLDAEMKLATVDKTIAGATQAIERAINTLAQFQATLEQQKALLASMQQEATQVKSSIAPTPSLEIAVSPDNRNIISAQANGNIQLLRADKGTTQSLLRGGFNNLASLIVSAQNRVVELAQDGRALTWNIANQWTLVRVIGTAEDSPFSDRITALDFSDDGQSLAVGSGAPSRFGELKLLSVADGHVIRDFGQVHSDSILSVKISPDGKSIATGAADKLVRIHAITEEKPPRTLEGHTHHVLGLAWNDDSYWVASSSADNSIKIWDVESGTATRTIQGFGKEVTSLSFVGRTNQVFSTSADQQSRLHDASNGGLVRAMGGPGDAIYASTVTGATPVGIAGGQDGTLWIWQLDNGQAIQQIK